MSARLDKHLYTYGWTVITFPDKKPILKTRALLLKKLRTMTKNKKITLEDYHRYIDDDKEHTAIQIELSNYFKSHSMGPGIIASNKDIFVELLGQDIDVQKDPYLRITRPHKPQDNIGYHRDTFYGGSPFELSVVIPFCKTPAPSSLSVLDGSHTKPEDTYTTTQIISKDVKKGDEKHKLGFMYAPKVVDEKTVKGIHPVALKLGQALVFSLSTMHGSKENLGKTCRWSTDCRVKHALAPVDLSKRPEYYKPLTRSAVTKQAEEYLKNNC